MNWVSFLLPKPVMVRAFCTKLTWKKLHCVCAHFANSTWYPIMFLPIFVWVDEPVGAAKPRPSVWLTATTVAPTQCLGDGHNCLCTGHDERSEEPLSHGLTDPLFGCTWCHVSNGLTLTSTKERGWNGYIPDRSWELIVCEKSKQTCVSNPLSFLIIECAYEKHDNISFSCHPYRSWEFHDSIRLKWFYPWSFLRIDCVWENQTNLRIKSLIVPDNRMCVRKARYHIILVSPLSVLRVSW